MADDNYIVRMPRDIAVTVIATPGGKLVFGGDGIDADPANALEIRDGGLFAPVASVADLAPLEQQIAALQAAVDAGPDVTALEQQIAALQAALDDLTARVDAGGGAQPGAEPNALTDDDGTVLTDDDGNTLTAA